MSKKRRPQVKPTPRFGSIEEEEKKVVDEAEQRLNELEAPKTLDELDPEVRQHLETCDELGLYLMARDISEFMARLGRDWVQCNMMKPRPDTSEIDETLVRARFTNRFIAQCTTRFGVKEPLMTVESRIIGGKPAIKPSQAFINWFMHWHKYISEMPDDWWETVKKKIETGESTADIRPPAPIIDLNWLVKQVDPKGEIPLWEEYKLQQGHTKLHAIINFMKSDDQLWYWKNPDGEEEGFVVMAEYRPVVSAAFVDMRPKETVKEN